MIYLVKIFYEFLENFILAYKKVAIYTLV
jgi:hypothetical protein